ncbi:MAG: autotransporter outer membrane beta-barrel domain-containing protein [Elusimicrobia bacterium]|nr:autotransporter outer membrane beta-barrel domain-containing protein [Elusimicrobiota bacterium]
MPGGSPGQSAVIDALNGAAGGGDPDFSAFLTALGALGPEQQKEVLNQLSPTALSSLGGLSSAGAGGQSAAVGQRLASLRSNPGGDAFAVFSVRGRAVYGGPLTADPAGDLTNVDASAPDRGWGFFAAPMGGFGRRDAVASQPGFSFNSAGLIVGADRRIDGRMAVGLSLGHVYGSAVTAAGGGSSTSHSLRYGAYGTVFGETFHADMYIGGARDWYRTSRNIVFPGVSRSASSTPEADEFNVNAQAGWDLKTSRVTLSPTVGLAFDRLMIHSFTEDGAGAVNLKVDGQVADSVRSTLGTKLSRKFGSGTRTVTPYVSGAWQRELANQSRAITAQFASGGAPFSVNTAAVSRDAGLVGAGVETDWGKGLSSKLGYTGDLRPDFEAHNFSANVRVRF